MEVVEETQPEHKRQYAMNQENNKIERRRIGQPNGQSPQTLDQKITACLANEKAATDDIEALTQLAETDLAYAQRKLEQERALALDPSLDAEEALQSCKLAELQVARLRNSLQLLQQKHRQVLAEEYHQRFLDKQHVARQARDAASARFGRIEALQNKMIDIFNQALAADQLVDQANSDAPAGEGTRLLRTEEHCKGLEDGRSHVSLLKETTLFDFNGNQSWPPRTSIASAYAAMSAPMDHRRYMGDASNEWWRRGQLVDEARDQQEQRLDHERDDFYRR
jgi:hypothetical protein